MRNVKGRRRGNNKKFLRSVRRTTKNILLMPGRIPQITADTVEASMRICEVFGVLFVVTLVARLTVENTIFQVLNLVSGIAFFGLMAFIKLADYQDKLIREQLSNYMYLR